MLGARADEALGVAGIGLVEHLLSLLDDLFGPAVMQHIGCQKCDSAVMVLVVVPGEKALAKGACILDRAEALRELGPVLEGLELALRVWVVVGDVRPTMSFGHSQISQHERDWL